eukprot:gene3980-biopygen2834
MRPNTLRLFHRKEFKLWVQKVRAVLIGYDAKDDRERQSAQLRLLDLPLLNLQPKAKKVEYYADDDKTPPQENGPGVGHKTPDSRGTSISSYDSCGSLKCCLSHGEGFLRGTWFISDPGCVFMAGGVVERRGAFGMKVRSTTPQRQGA